MAARWELYDGTLEWARIEEDSIQTTVARLRSLGVKRIVAVGQFPTWQGPVPRILANSYRASSVETSLSAPPIRNSADLKHSVFDAEERIGRAFSVAGAIFVSPRSSLCNDEGCILITPDGSGTPISFDTGHLSKEGSAYFVEWNRQELIGR